MPPVAAARGPYTTVTLSPGSRDLTSEQVRAHFDALGHVTRLARRARGPAS